MGSGQRALSGAAFATLLLIALMMGANHVAARMAFNHGVDVATAVAFRSLSTALSSRHKQFLPLLGLLIGIQRLCRISREVGHLLGHYFSRVDFISVLNEHHVKQFSCDSFFRAPIAIVQLRDGRAWASLDGF